VWVSCQSPYFVASKMSKIRAASLFTPSPDGWARAAVAAIGAPGGDADSTVPYWPHALQDWVMQTLPRSVVTSYVMGLHAGLRKKYLAKAAKGQ
jgi:17beta-estradiol 17-dehydrogenase / very-long-chain 3-oxoacyl-CoA reductase